MKLSLRAITLSLVFAFFVPSIAMANEAIETQPIAQGQLVYPVDINQWPETSRNEAGGVITSLTGAQNLLPASNPLAATLSNSSMTFTIGGGGQTIIAQDSTSGGSGNTRYIDSCPPQTITIPANTTGSARTDLLSIEYNQLATNPHSVPFSNNTTQTVSNALESCLYSYNTATSTPPTNYLAFASFSVPNGATTASQAIVSYLFPTISAQLATVLGGVVDSVNGQQGAVTLAQGNGILVTTAGGAITTTLSTPVSTANGGNGTGSPSLTAGTNLSSSGSWAGQTLNVVGNPTFSTMTASGIEQSALNASTAITLSIPGIAATGDTLTQRTGSTGALIFGGTSSAAKIDYNITNSGALTANVPIAVNGQVRSTGLTINPILFSNTAGGSNATAIDSSGSIVIGGIHDTVFGLAPQGIGDTLAFDAAGDLAIAGALSASSLTLSTGPLGISSGGNGTSSPSLSSGSNTSISGSWPSQAVNVSSSPTFSGTATAQYLNMSGNQSGYATAGFPLGVASNNPKWVSGTGTASTGGTSNSYPNSFSFSSAGECFSGPAGGFGQVGATWGRSSVTLYTNNGTPSSVQYFCVGI